MNFSSNDVSPPGNLPTEPCDTTRGSGIQTYFDACYVPKGAVFENVAFVKENLSLQCY